MEHPGIFSIKMVEAYTEKDPMLKIIRDAIRDKNPKVEEIITSLGQNYGQHFPGLAVKKTTFRWMGDSQNRRRWRAQLRTDCTTNTLTPCREKIYAAFELIWMPMMHCNLEATAKLCKNYLEAGRNFKSDIAKSDVGEMFVPKEANGIVQLDL